MPRKCSLPSSRANFRTRNQANPNSMKLTLLLRSAAKLSVALGCCGFGLGFDRAEEFTHVDFRMAMGAFHINSLSGKSAKQQENSHQSRPIPSLRSRERRNCRDVQPPTPPESLTFLNVSRIVRLFVRYSCPHNNPPVRFCKHYFQLFSTQ